MQLFNTRAMILENAKAAERCRFLRYGRKDQKRRQGRNRQAIRLLVLLALATIPMGSDVSGAQSQMNNNLTEADSGSTADVAVGANLNVLLHVPSQEVFKASCLWSKITGSGDAALQEVTKYVLLPTGTTAAFFRAVHPGVVQLRSNRYDCAKGVKIEWRVDVRVTAT